MNKYLEQLGSKLDEIELKKLSKIQNTKVHQFVLESIELCNPQKVFICSDTPSEVAYIKHMAIASGEESAALSTPGHTFHFDGPRDQGRDREVTKFLVPKGDSLPPALKQIDREEGLKEIISHHKDSMKGKTMIVIFLLLGPADSVFTIPCMECTDSWYVSHSVDLLYRRGYQKFCKISKDTDFLKTLHSAGKLNENMVSVEYDKKRIYIDYTTNTVYSVNTQYAGNSIGFKKQALRLAIRKAHKEGWLAEHFMILGVKGKNGRKTYFAGAFPSASGKTSTAMLPGETILADDLAYVKNIDGECRAVNVECGIFGIIQNVNPGDDPLIYQILTQPGDIIFSNVLIKDEKPWWLGMGCELPKEGINYSGKWWEGKTDENGDNILPSHKNARYTVSLKALPNCDPELENPKGVKLGGIMFGGRDYRGYVPVQQGLDWAHGILAYGAALETETTFATVGQEGKHEINVMSIQDFVSIPLGQYIKNYLEFGKKLNKVPLVFGVNYFLRDLKTGAYLNTRRDKYVWVKWMELRVNNDVKARETPTGLIPLYEDLVPLFKQLLGKDYTKEEHVKQFTIRVPENLLKIERVKEFLKAEVSDAPQELFDVLDEQKGRLVKAKERFGNYISPENFEIV
ncbi:MAG: phosphoenolpyruvate carboxykinase (GTP) [Methanocellales archaeon]|nr:phosphoenolpyruvate carboxykinase (GTP) [Methanocellales archaeon]MDD3420985.1 phosphoenolpyruvate carboxykinase (GTP) [Methanocellales archaeon]MDD4898122.1 phosphoenolpyruvate carboxykinase (GTP) [Methanocellales archaeon]MDD5447171.1 phosphoenolpyruvate carboxykinase (GTP) [Methanocellales archaeon]